jgi:surface antigen
MKINTIKKIIGLKSSRVVLVLLAAVIMVAGPVQIMNSPVFADEYDDRIAALQKDIEGYKAESDRLNSEATTLQVAVNQLANQKNAIQAQIDLNQVKYDKLIIQITDTEKKIVNNQDALGKIIADLYVDDNISPIEMIAGSKNISDYMDKQEYRNSVRTELKSTISKVKSLKLTLETQKAEVEKILADQKSQRDTLAAKETEQQKLLDSTRGDEAAYQGLIADSQAQINEARATQTLLRNRFQNSGGYVLVDGGSLGDYPWNSSNCPMWGYLSTGGSNGIGGDGYGYGCRQCASYVAWKIAKATNYYPSWGNAKDFTANAQARFGVGDGKPHPGSIAVMDPGKAGQSYGHVAWVESEPVQNSDGHSVILISQYNYNYGAGYGMYSQMWLSVNAFDHYVQIVK